MSTFTPDEDKEVVALERRLRGPRVLLCKAPRYVEGIQQLTNWQMYALADALSLPEATRKVLKTRFEELPREKQNSLLHEELLSYDEQKNWSSKSFLDPAYWSPLMQKYLAHELRS